MDGQQPTAEPTPDNEAPADDAADAGGADQTGDVEAAATVVADATGEPASGDTTSDPAAGGKRRERPHKPRRDPHEPQFGGLFLDELQRIAGLRGQFAYGVPETLWRANREQTIRILREEVPMPTFKHQIHCILHADPIELAHDVHYEMLSAAAPTNDSFRWLWLYMMLR